MDMKRISVIIPAHNEERYVPKCLASIRAAAKRVDLPVEIVVVLNRCSDDTGGIAERSGALIVEENTRNLARIRNAGVQASSGDVLATIDADSWMSRDMLQAILRLLATGKYVGGGVRMKGERMSLGIFCSIMTFLPHIAFQGLSGGLFWLKRKDFDAINGFNEELVSAEDVDFARRLKAYGAARGLRFGTVLRAHILTSCRKFDCFGDWYLIRDRQRVDRILSGRDREAADHFYYDFDRWDGHPVKK